VRIESSVTSVSWIPLDAVEGGQRLLFHVGAFRYDQPPPDRLDDLDGLLDAGAVRFANRLRAWVEVDGGRVVGHGQQGGGLVGAAGRAPDPEQLGFATVALPDLRPDPQVGETSVRFLQTTGGLTPIGLPCRPAADASPRLVGPAAWTTLALTIHADGASEPALVGASPFPRHWVYGHDGRLVAKSALVDFATWNADAWDPFTPWGGHDAPVRVSAVESALERALSRVIVDAKPHWLRLRRGATLVEQGESGTELFLLFDGVLAVEVDGATVAQLGPGAILGEMALLEGGRRTATLRAVTSCRVAAVPGDRVDRADLAELARRRRRPGRTDGGAVP
jgi:hypothetical protein